MMQGINKEMNNVGLNILLQHKVRKYYEFQHSQQNEDREQNRLTLIENLPSQIKQEVLLDVNMEFLTSISFINQLTQECKDKISLCVKQRIFYPDEEIFQQKEYNSCLYFISQGSVQLSISISTKNHSINKTHSEMVIEQLKKKDVFGFEGFFYNCPNSYNAKCINYSVITYIERDELVSILQKFPEDYEKFCFLKDEIVLSGKYKMIHQKCYSCGDFNHSFRDCQKINPVFNWRDKYQVQEKQINPQRNSKFIRRTVSMYNAVKDQSEISKMALRTMVQYDEESFLSDLCSVLIEEEKSEMDQSSLDEKQEDQNDNKISQFNNNTEEDENLIQERNQNVQRKQKQNKKEQNQDQLDEENRQLIEQKRQKQRKQMTKKNTRINIQDINLFLQQISQNKKSKDLGYQDQEEQNNNKNNPQKSKFSKFKFQDQDLIMSQIGSDDRPQISDQNDELRQNNQDLIKQISSKQNQVNWSDKENELIVITEQINEQLENSGTQKTQDEIKKNYPENIMEKQLNLSVSLVQFGEENDNQYNQLEQINIELQKKDTSQNQKKQVKYDSLLKNSKKFDFKRASLAQESDINEKNLIQQALTRQETYKSQKTNSQSISRRSLNTMSMSCNESQFQNVREHIDDEQNLKNQEKMQDYDIFNKLYEKRVQKAQKNYLMKEKVVKKISDEISLSNENENSTQIDDIFKQFQRSVSKKISLKKKSISYNPGQQTPELHQLFIQNILQTPPKKQIYPQEQFIFNRKMTSYQQGFEGINTNFQPNFDDKNISLVKHEQSNLPLPILNLELKKKGSKLLSRTQSNEDNSFKFQKLTRSRTAKVKRVDIAKEAENPSTPNRKGSLASRGQQGKMIIPIKHFERKSILNNNINQLLSGNNQLTQNNTSDNSECYGEAYQTANPEEAQESSEYMIRCLYNLQDLDLLIVRKKFQMEQQKGLLKEYIFVEDNEIDLDVSKEYSVYYPLQNLKDIIKNFRKNQNKMIKSLYPYVKMSQLKNLKQKRGKLQEQKGSRQSSKSHFTPQHQQSIFSNNNLTNQIANQSKMI